MATKHINDELWNRIEALTVKANTMHGLLRPIKEAEVLHLVLQRGWSCLRTTICCSWASTGGRLDSCCVGRAWRC